MNTSWGEGGSAGWGKGLPGGRRREAFHLGWQIWGCARRVGWPVGVAGCPRFALRSSERSGCGHARSFLLGARVACSQKNVQLWNCQVLHVESLASRRQCLLQRLAGCRFCRDSVSAKEWSEAFLGSTPPGLAARPRQRRLGGAGNLLPSA